MVATERRLETSHTRMKGSLSKTRKKLKLDSLLRRGRHGSVSLGVMILPFAHVAFCQYPSARSLSNLACVVAETGSARQRVEIPLQDNGGGHRIIVIVVAQHALRFDAGAALVDELGGNTKAPVQLIRKAAAPEGMILLAAIGHQRQAHHHSVRLPFIKQLCDGFEALFSSTGRKYAQRAGMPGKRISQCDPDFLQTIIEGQHSFLRHGPRRPSAWTR